MGAAEAMGFVFGIGVMAAMFAIVAERHVVAESLGEQQRIELRVPAGIGRWAWILGDLFSKSEQMVHAAGMEQVGHHRGRKSLGMAFRGDMINLRSAGIEPSQAHVGVCRIEGNGPLPKLPDRHEVRFDHQGRLLLPLDPPPSIAVVEQAAIAPRKIFLTGLKCLSENLAIKALSRQRFYEQRCIFAMGDDKNRWGIVDQFHAG